MSKIISEINETWEKKSWLNDFVNNVKLGTSLTEDYANDILEAVSEDYFPSLDAAIADLQTRVGLTASEAGRIKTAAIELVKKAEAPACELCKDEIPGNKEVAGDKLVKEAPEAVASANTEVVTAGMPEHLKQYQFKKKEDAGEKKEGETEKKEDDKKEASVSKLELLRLAKTDKAKFAAAVASLKNESDKKYAIRLQAWFQGADEPTKEGDVTSNDPKKIGYPKEMAYPHKPMEVPVGGDSRDWEQKHFEDAAKDTKKVMGPVGEEFKLKVEMQRIPEGEKEANASIKRLNLIKAIVKSAK